MSLATTWSGKSDVGELRRSAASPAGYYTDGESLYRLLGETAPLRPGALAAVEDCLTLRVILVPAARLLGNSMRPVRPGA